MGPPILAQLRAPTKRPWSREEQIAPAHRREQRQPAGRRLHQSDLEAPCRRGRQETWRNFVGRRDLSDPGQPMLAATRALYFLDDRHTAAPGAEQDHHSL